MSPSTSTLSEHGCCVCRSNADARPFGTREGVALLRCARCSLVFSASLPDPDEDFMEAAQGRLQEKGKHVEFWSLPDYYSKHENIFRTFFRERLYRLNAFSPPPGAVLDIGSGFGFWMNFLRENRVRTEGIEPAPEAARFSRENFDLNVKQCRFEDFVTETRFSAISACDVLEHFHRPDLALGRCRELLLPDGLIYIQVPNVLGLRIPHGHGLGLPFHVWQFNPKSLFGLLKRSGFVPLRYWTGIQGVIGAYERGGPALTTLAKWKLARALKIGNRLQVIARKAS